MDGEHRNEVTLRGRLSGAPEERSLPSGDVVVTFRMVVDRDGQRGRNDAPRGGAGHDTISCAAWRADVRRRVLKAGAGDVLEVDGALRRRFWRSPHGAASRYEVEVVRLRRPG